MALALRTGLRASEISSARFGDLQPSAAYPGKYNLHVTRKGGVVSALPVLPEVVRAYRTWSALNNPRTRMKLSDWGVHSFSVQ